MTVLALEFLYLFLRHSLQIQFVFFPQFSEFIDHLHFLEAQMLSNLVNLVLNKQFLLLACVEPLQVMVVNSLHLQLLLVELFFLQLDAFLFELPFLVVDLLLNLNLFNLD